ncbi:Protein of unknown function [Streptomyces sp. WMMB 714]|uniref:DUF2975 domain-containing protein n=1 Tax=Streptomyces sp. WMMB 714 TaxID=1286822 RepID=UPI000695C408|nr:DUF2975 domain-containing protein [Streptomyces sp. WMMB 714]SCK56600.1 Protein of unknown function [Streptomyces sp. WMMB 714]
MGISEYIRSREPRRFASERLVRRLAGAVLWLGVIAGVAGVAYDVSGMTQAPAHVSVPVEVRTVEGLSVETSRETRAGSQAPLAAPDSKTGDVIRLNIADAPESSWLEAGTGPTELRSWGSTVAEQALARADSAVLGLCAFAGALLLRRLLLSIAEGDPFRQGNAVRVAGLAVLTAFGSLCTAAVPALASGLVLERLGLDGADAPVAASVFSLPQVPLFIALLLLALAEVFRRGTELAQDVDGLV